MSNILQSGQQLQAGEFLASSNGQYSAVMQPDGNFVLYIGTPPDNLVGAMWASGTHATGDLALRMQTDGNLVVYDNGSAVWAGPGRQGDGSYFAIMQDDGNLVLNRGDPEHNGGAYWATGTWQGTAWLRNDGAYVAKIRITYDSASRETGNILVGHCDSVNWAADVSAPTISLIVVEWSGAESVMATIPMGVSRAQRFRSWGTYPGFKWSQDPGLGCW